MQRLRLAAQRMWRVRRTLQGNKSLLYYKNYYYAFNITRAYTNYHFSTE